MINFLIALFMCASLLTMSGCASTQPQTQTQIVKVPVVTKCEPSVRVTEIVEYPFDKATKEMTLYEKSQLLAAENKLLKGQNIELKAALSECTK